MTIALCDLRAQYDELRDELDEAIRGAAESCQYIMGPNVRALEQEVSAYLGCQHAVAVNSGTDALYLALRALRIGPGDEVVTTPFTFIATASAIQMAGATPVFVDIEPDSLNIDADKIADAITPRTRAILPVHLFGRPANMAAIMELAKAHDLRVVEDCAQSMGATLEGCPTGTIGDVGCFSFFPSKNLGCMGDGGMLVTDDAEVYNRAEMLRRHGGKVKYHHGEQGVNSRLDDLQAAVLRVKLPHLDRWNRLRREHAARYASLLTAVPGVAIPPCDGQNATLVFHQYTVLCEHRDRLLQALTDRSIGCAIYYPLPLHLQPMNRHLEYRKGDFPAAEYAADHCLSLPMHPHLKAEDQHQVAQTLRQASLRGESREQRRAG